MYYRRKLFALFHDPFLKPLFRNKAEKGSWRQLTCLRESEQDLLNWWSNQQGILSDHIASASDRLSFRQGMQVDATVEQAMTAVEICHPITGTKQQLHFGDTYTDDRLIEIGDRAIWIQIKDLRGEEGAKKAFWWVWRFYGEAIASDQGINNREALLLPAETRLPDCSIISHNATASTLAGALFPKDDTSSPESPWLLMFSFSPVQEFIKASRKFLDFWAGSYLLHYLSAKLCWYLAQKYGPDVVITPNLYSQSIIDAFLLQKYPDFEDYFKHFQISNPVTEFEDKTSISLSTAGFPNVIAAVIPDCDKDQIGQELADELKKAWQEIGHNVKETIKKTVRALFEDESRVNQVLEWIADTCPEGMQDALTHEFLSWQQGGRWEWNALWKAQLEHTWETYWVVLPLGHPDQALVTTRRDPSTYKSWKAAQDGVAQPKEPLPTSLEEAIYANINVGTWWPALQQRLGQGLSALKSTRNWQIPVAPGERSTISGQYSAVHPNLLYRDRFCEGGGLPASSLRLFWQVMSVAFPGLFNGSERLNAMELTKRMAWKHGGLATALGIDCAEDDYDTLIRFPNLSAIAAARFMNDYPEQVKAYWNILNKKIQASSIDRQRFGSMTRRPNQIRQVDESLPDYNGVMFSSKWLGDDLALEGNALTQLRHCVMEAHQEIGLGDRSPADWWCIVLADGDNMGDYVRGKKLKKYREYVATKILEQIQTKATSTSQAALRESWQRWQALIEQTDKRMGPATHVGLNRALLDFSNRLVPYLAEDRYCGRVVYSGGDDVMVVLPPEDVLGFVDVLRAAWSGDQDPGNEFESKGGYWQAQRGTPPRHHATLGDRWLFTMGEGATLSAGVVIAHKSVPLPTVLENLWQAEKDRAKALPGKDGLCFRVIYGSGNTLEALLNGDLLKGWFALLEAARQESDLLKSLFYRLAEDLPRHCYISPDHLLSKAARVILSRRDAAISEDFQTQLLMWCDDWEKWALKNQPALGATLADLSHLFQLSAFFLDKLEQVSGAEQEEAA